MDERMRRQWAAAESRAYGWGGVEAVSGAIRMSPNTIRKGLAELMARESNSRAHIDSRLRKEVGRRKRYSEADPGLLGTLVGLVEPLTRGELAIALEVQEHNQPVKGIKSHGAFGQPSDGRPAAERGWL